MKQKNVIFGIIAHLIMGEFGINFHLTNIYNLFTAPYYELRSVTLQRSFKNNFLIT
jgi:hypothetical protein